MHEFGKEQFHIELLEEYYCENNEQLRAREGHHIRQKGTINGIIEGRTHKERIEEQKERWQEYRRNIWQDKKEEMSQFNKLRFVCGCGVEMSHASKSRHQYSQKHQAFLRQHEN